MNVRTKLSDALIRECRNKLVTERTDLMNRVRASRVEFQTLDRTGGDEADQTMAVLAEHEYLTTQQRLTAQLMEIDFALARIDNGSYGICEETEEEIERERLQAIPWTRLSIEGAEIREAVRRRFAK